MNISRWPHPPSSLNLTLIFAIDPSLQVALIDQLTEDEELALIALDQRMVELERCVLSMGERVLFDKESKGYVGGVVCSFSESGSVRVQLGGEDREQELARAKLLKAPATTAMHEGQCVRVA